MSHHTGITMRVLSAHTRASTAYAALMMKSQPIIDSVAIFPARQCQGNGRSRDKADIIATGANSGCSIVQVLCRREKRGHGRLRRRISRNSGI